MSQRPIAAASGLLFVALDLVALFLPGPPPKASDSARHITESLAGHRPQILAGLYLAGLAILVWLVFLGVVSDWLARQDGDAGLRVAALGGALIALAAQLVGLLLFYGAAFKIAGQHQYALVRGLTDAGNAAVELSKFGFAAFIAGVCLSGRQLLPSSLLASGFAATGALVLSAVPLVSEGRVTEFGGGLDLAGAAPATLWIATLSGLLGLRASSGRPGAGRRAGVGVS